MRWLLVTMGGDTTLVTALLGIITTLLGVISYVYRDSLKRADGHMEAMEARYDALLSSFPPTLAQVAASQASMFELIKKMQETISQQQFEVEVAKRLQAASQHGGGLLP